MAKVELTRQSETQIDALPKTIRLRLLDVVRRLEKWPNVSGSKPLRGSLSGRFRIRTGDYRVQFYLEGDVVVIEKVGKRDRFYED
jgi:mRNA-degrading endonuclease RelE of RelBE toxin-antitoxin system